MAGRKILLVEGRDDEYVLKHLCGQRGVQNLDEITPLGSVERLLENFPVRLKESDVEALGYDIESKDPKTGKLRFIEVKGRASGEQTLTVSRNEILYSLNTPDDFILGMVEFVEGGSHQVHYLRCPFQREPDFHVTNVNYNFPELLARAEAPR